MFIRIDESVLNNTDNFTDDEINCIENIALSMKENKHIVFSDYNILKKLISMEKLSRNSKKVFNSILKRWSLIYGLEKNIYGNILVVDNNQEMKRIIDVNRIIYRVPLKYFDDTEKILPLHIIGEDESDCNFYEDIARRYIKDNGLGISINTRRVHGGGNRTGSIYQRELTKYNKICLVIADSDKESELSNIGDTAKDIKNIYDSNKDKYVTDIYILKVREKENLIPPNLYKMCTNSSNSKRDLEVLKYIFDNELLQNIYYYSDIKDGITYKSLLTNKNNIKSILSYIDEIMKSGKYEQFLVKIEKYQLNKLYSYINSYIKCNSGDEFEEISCTILESTCQMDNDFKDSKITNGIGYMLETARQQIICLELDKSIKEKERIYSINNNNTGLKNEIEKLKYIFKIINKVFDLLPDNIKMEWEAIANKIITWGCCLNEFIA